MIINLYSIRDIKNDYNTPFAAANDKTAERMYKAELSNKDSMIAKFPADFELWRLATMNTDNGYIEANKEQIAIGGQQE